MGKIDFKEFLKDLDIRLENYFKNQAEFICCKKGCSACCEKGDYPISELELEYLMQGYIALDSNTKIQVQHNIETLEKGGKCPFLVNRECSVYSFRPIICRIHGLAYICEDGVAKVPYCTNNGLNYSKVYDSGTLLTEPIQENLDTTAILQNQDFGEIRNLYDWIKNI